MGRMPTHRGFDSSLGFLSGAENHFNQSACSDRLCLTATGQPPGGKRIPGITQLFDLWHDETPGTVAETGADKGWGDDRWTDHVIDAINKTTAVKPLFACVHPGQSGRVGWRGSVLVSIVCLAVRFVGRPVDPTRREDKRGSVVGRDGTSLQLGSCRG